MWSDVSAEQYATNCGFWPTFCHSGIYVSEKWAVKLRPWRERKLQRQSGQRKRGDGGKRLFRQSIYKKVLMWVEGLVWFLLSYENRSLLHALCGESVSICVGRAAPEPTLLNEILKYKVKQTEWPAAKIVWEEWASFQLSTHRYSDAPQTSQYRGPSFSGQPTNNPQFSNQLHGVR